MTSKLKKALLLGGKKSELPAGYTRLAYLENSVRTHIATGLQVSNNARVEITATPLVHEAIDCFCGNYVTGNVGKNYYILYSSSVIQYLYGTPTYNTPIATVFGKKYNIVANGGNFYIDGERVLSGLEEPAPFTTPNFYLFSRGYSGPNRLDYGLMRIYDFNVRNDGIQQAVYVPVVDPSGVPCMYDKVTQTAKYPIIDSSILAGIESLAQLYSLLANLPDLTGQEQKTLTIRLDAALQTDELRAMIDERGEAKNWEITEAV